MIQLNLLVSWLDGIYSMNLFLAIGLFILWVILLRWLILKIKKSWLAIPAFLGGIAIPIVMVFLKSSYGLGYLHEGRVDYVGISKNYIALTDHYVTHSKGGRSKTHRRMYLIDANKGDVLFRKPTKGKVQRIVWVGDQIMLKSGYKSQYFSLGGKSRLAFNKAKLKNLPELKSGIYKQGYNALTDQLWVVNKKGEKFYYNAQTLKREPQGTPKVNQKAFVKVPHLSKVRFRFRKEKQRYDQRMYCPVSLRGRTRKQLRVNAQTVDKYFLFGKLILCFPTMDLALISSFETTDRKKIKLTAVSTNTGKTLWEYTQDQLDVKDRHSRPVPKITYIIPTGDHDLTLLIGGFLLRMEAKTGKVRWKTRL